MKILVIYATAGAGHRKAAEAIYNALKEIPGHDTRLVDVLDYSSRFYQVMYSRTYTFLITKIPWFWGGVFKLLDIPVLVPLILFVRRIQNSLHLRKLEKFLVEEQFDVIFSTHFMVNEVAGNLRAKGAIRGKLIGAITDYDVHSIWLHPGVDCYTAAVASTRDTLLALGVPDEKIRVTGIPVDMKFSRAKNIDEIRNRMGLKFGVCTVLMATGSFGIGPIEEILERLDGFQVMVVCGHNKELYGRLSRQQKELVKILGLVNNMDELMVVSDIMLTKPGGLSISEALVVGLPMIFFNAIPGQETNNIRVLRNHGVGIDTHNIDEIVQALKSLQASPEELRSAKEKSRSLGKPSAALDIASLVH